MALYSAAVTTPAAAAGATYATIRASSTDRLKIREIGCFLNAATASSIQLVRPSNTPVATTSALGQAQDPADPASTGNVDTAWSTAPTIGSNVPMRRAVLPHVAGNGIIWTFPPGQEIIIPASGWLVVWNHGGAAGSAMSLYVIWDE
jgi:hypothetical protein